MKLINEIGNVYGDYKVVGRQPNSSYGAVRWRLQCKVCNNIRIVDASDLRKGNFANKCLNTRTKQNQEKQREQILETKTKVCTGCRKELPLNKFGTPRKCRPIGSYRANCNDCLNEYRFEFMHGITRSEYKEFLVKQNYKCAICMIDLGKPNKGRKYHPLDHCHKTGKIRGIVHSNCNRALGLIYEDEKIAEKMVEYIRKHK